MSEEQGLVVARYRKHVTVEDARDRRHVCQIRGRRLDPVVGDEVVWEPSAGEGVVTEVLGRRTTLERIDKRGRREIVAANLTRLLVVIAPRPEPDWFVLDRYLAGAALADIDAMVVFNKIDLAPAPPELEAYRAAGYPVCLASAREHTGLAELGARMRGQLAAFVGQSGVGKSSLMNALVGDELQPVAALSAKGAQGRHTTSTAVLHRLPGGGRVIDSPGVRHFAPYIDDPARLEHAYREFEPYLGRCKFADCRHLAEPDCSIKSAVAAGAIAPSRYRSYASLYELVRSLAEERYGQGSTA